MGISRHRGPLQNPLDRPFVRMFLQLMLFFTWKSGVYAGSYGETVRLQQDLFRNYSVTVRPLLNQREAISIALDLHVFAVHGLEMKTQTMRTTGLTFMAWQDEILTWRPDDYGGVSAIKVLSSNIWLPVLEVTNIVSEKRSLWDGENLAQIYNNGTVMFAPGFTLETFCPVDIRLFPFDTQTCEIKIHTWMHFRSEMVLNHNHISNNDELTENGEYNVHVAEVEKHPEYEAIVFKLKLDRRPLYYILVLILPIFILSLLCIVSFLIPASSGEKMSVSMTTLLSFTVYLGVIDSAMPKVSTSVSVLAVYVTAMLFLSFVAVLGNACVVLLYLEKGDNPAPKGDNQPNINKDKETVNTGSGEEHFLYGVSGKSRERPKENETQPIHKRVNTCMFWLEVVLLLGTLGAVLWAFLHEI